MTSLGQPSSTCANLKEANEIPVKVSTTELNCAKLESTPCIINPKLQTSENTPTTTVAHLQEQMKYHTKRFTCWICDKSFWLMTQLTSHLTDCSMLQKSMHCTTCDKTFEFPALFKQHKLIYHPEGQPREAFQKKQVLVQNIQQYLGKVYFDTHTVTPKWYCQICQKEFSNKYYASQEHALLHEVSNFFCVVCHKEFRTSKIDFKTHMQQHVPNNQPPFKCEHCFKEFGKRSRLWSHYRLVHPLKRVNVTTETDSSVAMVKKTVAENNILSESDTPICNRDIIECIKEAYTKNLTCPECQKKCQSKYSLLEHLQLHEIRDFICVVCQKNITTTKIDFKIHMQQHCTPDTRGRFNCEHCPRSYSHKKALISHYRVKHPPKRVFNEKEGSENCEQTQQIALVKSEPNESDSTIMHSEIIINKISEDDEDNNLLELEKAARYEKFCDENELTERVSSMESEPSSPESPYINLEDDKITVEETHVIIVKKDNNLIELEKSASYSEFDEANKLTELVSLMKSEPLSPESSYVKLEDDKFIIEETDVKTDAITHNEIIIKKTPEDNNLLELKKAAHNEKFREENELTELVSSMKSEPSSPESSYFNLEHEKFIIDETNVKTDESKSKSKNFYSKSWPVMVKNNDPRLVDVDENQQKTSYECHECHVNYTKASYLHNHILKKHAFSLCWICGEKFLNNQLDLHIETHVRRYTCKLCNKSFKRRSNLEKHNKRNCHNRKGISRIRLHNKLFSCKICGERFISERHLEKHLDNHLKTHTEDEPCCIQNLLQWQNQLFSCKLCGKRFITERHLENHLKTHTEDKSTCVSKQDFANETESSIDTVTRRNIERRKRKTGKKREDVTLPDPLDVNVSVNDEDFCKQSELSELMDLSEPSELCELITSEPASLKSGKSSRRNNAQPSSLDIGINIINGKLVDVNDAVDEQKNHNITNHNHKPDDKGPFKCKHCPKYFALKTNLTRHCRTDHLPKSGVTNESEVFTGKRFLAMLKKSNTQKQHVPQSNTDTVSYKEFCEQSELNEIVDGELVDTAKCEPSSPESPYYYVKSELDELVESAKFEKYDAAQSPYYYVITESKELVDTDKFELSSPESPYYCGNLEDEITIEGNEENTEELKPEILDGPSTSK